jgi:hypothetical protein
MRSAGHVRTPAVYLALALTPESEEELVRLCVGEAEGARSLAVPAHVARSPFVDSRAAAVWSFHTSCSSKLPGGSEAPLSPSHPVGRHPLPRIAAVRPAGPSGDASLDEGKTPRDCPLRSLTAVRARHPTDLPVP